MILRPVARWRLRRLYAQRRTLAAQVEQAVRRKRAVAHLRRDLAEINLRCLRWERWA